MKILTASFGLALALCAAAPTLASADAPAGKAREAFDRPIPNIPGKSVIAVVVDYPPGGKTPAHHHPASAFVNAYVLSGAIRSQVDGGMVRVYHVGESWSEEPGAHHQISENASETRLARLLAFFVVDSTDKELVTLDH